MCLDKINIIKKQLKKDKAEELHLRQLNLIMELGENADNYFIIDRREMTQDLIYNFYLALDPNSPSIKSIIPSSEKIRVRVGPTTGYEIRWSYDLRSGVDGPKVLPDGRTRDFCTNLLRANKLYTIEEIRKMDNGFGLSVFDYGGGFWTQPDGSVSPRCRHAWYQNIIQRK